MFYSKGIIHLLMFYYIWLTIVRELRMSLIISSAERLSFHVPQKRLAHPLRDLLLSVVGESIELLSLDFMLQNYEFILKLQRNRVIFLKQKLFLHLSCFFFSYPIDFLFPLGGIYVQGPETYVQGPWTVVYGPWTGVSGPET